MARSGDSNPVVARWGGGWRATVTSGPFTCSVDEPESAGGTNTAPMPTEYFLGSVASCYVLALQWCAAKRIIELPDLSVTAVGEYDGPRYSEIRLVVHSTLPAAQLEPLLEPASRVCYVSNTLAKPPIVEIAES
jgi:uncharacterized OsmC-like protein